MFCPHCGKQIPDDSRFCHYCGMKIQVQAVAQKQPSVSNPQLTNNVDEDKSVEQPIYHGGYNLNPKTPSFNWMHASAWDCTTAKSITEYKHNMGFASGKENIIEATQAITQQGKQPFLKQVEARKRKQNVYFGNSFDSDKYADIFILSFEDDGLLMIGLEKTITHHESRQGDYNSVDYKFMKHNGFIPKHDISQAKLFKYPLYRTLIVHTKIGILSFIIKPTWNDKLYQIKNYRHLPHLSNCLN